MAWGKISEKWLVHIVACECCKKDCNHEEARSLPCGHTFCLRCANWLTMFTIPGQTFQCYVCPERFVLPAGGAEPLRKARSTGRTRYAVKQQPTVTTAKSCDVCSGDEQMSVDSNASEPTVYCLDCHRLLCTGCNVQHSEQHCGHTTVDLDKNPNADVIYADCSLAFCDKHPTRRIERYCFNCRILICPDCSRQDHIDHRFFYIDEAGCPYRVGLKKQACVLEQVAEAAAKRQLTPAVIAESNAKFRRKVELLRRKVEAQADELTARLTAKIEREKQAILSYLNDFETNRISRRHNAREALRKYFKSDIGNTFPEYCGELSTRLLLDEMTHADTLLHLIGRLRTDWEQLGVIDVRFSASDLSFDGNGADLGYVIRDVVAEESSLTYPVLAEVIDGVGNGVLAMALLDNQLFVTRRNVAEVSVYDATTLQFQRDLTHSGFGNFLPGLAVRESAECLYVSDYINNCVHKVDLSAQLPIVTVSFLTAHNPIGLSYSPYGNLVVANMSCILQRFLRGGGRPDNIHRLNMFTPYHAVALNRDILVFSSQNASGMYTISTKRPGLTSLCDEESRNNLRCLTVADDQFVLAADKTNSRIIVVRPSAGKARHLPLDVDADLQSPCALCYDEDRGRLYIGEDGGQNRVLAFDRVDNFIELFQDSPSRIRMS